MTVLFGSPLGAKKSNEILFRLPSVVPSNSASCSHPNSLPAQHQALMGQSGFGLDLVTAPHSAACSMPLRSFPSSIHRRQGLHTFIGLLGSGQQQQFRDG